MNIRSIQRDLEKLSMLFPITCELRGRTNHWFWLDKSAITQIPAMNEYTALAFKLAGEYLRPIMPPSVLRLLKPYLNHATNILQQTKHGKWTEKTRIIGHAPELIAPTVNPKVQDIVYESLLEDRQFEVDYKGREQAEEKRRVLNPLGIVLKNGIIYLVATSLGYQDPRHYALHRMRHARLLETRSNPITGFDLAHHIDEEKGFSYPVSGGDIKLRALFSAGAAIHLTESRLSGDQKIVRKKDGRMLVEATVADTSELRWWLLGFGSYVEILAPCALRKEFSDLTEKMRNLYHH